MIARFYQLASVLLLLCVCACSSIPPGADYPKSVSTAIADPGHTALGKNFAQAAHDHPDSSGFRIIPVGAEGFLMRMQMISAAQRSVDLQYYIFHGDETGRLLTGAIVQAADRGVQFRILIDDAETEPGDEQIATLKAHPNIEVRIFNPFSYRGHMEFIRGAEFMVNANRLDYRMHNKLLIIDNAVALIGGRNIGDQYFQIDPDSQFADDDMFTAGPISQKLSETFDQFWNATMAIPVQALDSGDHSHKALDDLRKGLKEQRGQLKAEGVDYVTRIASGEPFNSIVTGRLPLVWAPVELVYDSPDKKDTENGMIGRLIGRDVGRAVSASQSELLMITPFLIPGAEGMQMFKELRGRHVTIRILTNSLESSTESLAQAGYMGYRKDMLDDGIELYEIRALLGDIKGSGQTKSISRHGNYSLHGKLLVMDRSRLFIGSMNFDQRSRHINTEIGLIIDSPVLAKQVAARFDAMVKPVNAYRLAWDSEHRHLLWTTEENGQSVTYDKEPAHSAWQRFKTGFWTIFPLDSEL